jgi:hypothetical protein
MPDGRRQPAGGRVLGCTNTPRDSLFNSRTRALVSGRNNYFSAVAGLVDIDRIVGFRTSSGHFKGLRRDAQYVLGARGRRQPATASAGGTPNWPEGVAPSGPSRKKNQP